MAAEILRFGRRLRLKALGTSMLLTVWRGDMLTIEREACESTVSADIVLLRDHRFVVHRLVARRNRSSDHCWVTRGDSLPQDDPPAGRHQLLNIVSCFIVATARTAKHSQREHSVS